MILRFDVDQAEASQRGVNVPNRTNHVDVDLSKFSDAERKLISDRLLGVDVMSLEWGQEIGLRALLKKSRIVAKLPTLESLMEAIRENQAQVDKFGAGDKLKMK